MRYLPGTALDEQPRHAEVAIIGGGVMGASVAYHLALRGQRDVLLLERGDLFGQGATGKCAGGIRFQFGSEIHVRLSLESIPMLERFEQELEQPIGLQHCGYLFVLTSPTDVEVFRRNVDLQRRLGVATEWLDADEVRRRIPLLQFDDEFGGTFNARDGLCDPSSVVNGYIHAARRLGVTCLTNVELIGAHVENNRVTTVVTPLGEIKVGSVVNAAGPFAADVGRMLGLDLPIVPLRRQMLVTTPLPEVPPDFTFVIDFATGLYFHREGPGILTGMANPNEPVGSDESVDLAWEQVHLEAAVRRFPLLAQAGLAHHWAGLYEMSPDAHPLIGRLEPLENAYVVAGFSGHGFMHGPIAGKLLAEVILDGSASTLDIAALSPTRFALHSAAPREYNVV
jgi:glycine/D-amino acid oxidase-like deaminating enzyme